MIKVMLAKQGAYFIFTIENRKITGIINGYVLPYQPPNLENVRSKILMSRNKLPAWTIDLFKINEKEQEEYDNAKDDEALKEIVIKDAKKEGAKIIDIKYE
jgi:hypothetical protein